MSDLSRLEEILEDMRSALENIESDICKMEKRDKCRYYCTDRGRHSINCPFFEQKHKGQHVNKDMTPEQLHQFLDSASPVQINQLHAQQAPEPEQEQSQETPAEVVAQPVPAQPVEEPVETPKERNFRELRENYLRAQWERDDLARQVADLKAKPQQAPIEEEPDITFDDDHLIEGKDLKKIIKNIERKVESRVSRELKQQHAVTQQQLIENRLKMELPDLDKVVCAKNLALLSQQHPELAATIQTNPDLYTQAKAAYTLIKKLGIEEPKKVDNSQRIQQNMAKPKPLQSVG